MKRNPRLEERRKKISREVDQFVDKSFDVVDRIDAVLKSKHMERRKFAEILGKNESEISKWMTGSHNFTLKTITLIECKLGETLLQVPKQVKEEKPDTIYVIIQNKGTVIKGGKGKSNITSGIKETMLKSSYSKTDREFIN